MQYAPLPKNTITIHLSNARTVVGAYCIRPYKHPARDDCIDHESSNDCPFLLGMIEGRMQYAPTWKHPYHPSIRYAYPCRGVLHTPYKHPARDDCIDHESPNDCPFSLGMIEGRMQYAPTWKYPHHLSIKYAYPCRGVLHTPHKHPARDGRIDHEFQNDCPFLLGMIEGRMQYSPTWKYPYHPSIKCAYRGRGVLHTPHKHPVRDEWIDLKSEKVDLFSLGVIGRRMQYVPTRAHIYLKPSIVPDDGAHLYLKFFVVSDNNKYLFQELNIVSIDDRYIAQLSIIASINNK